MTQKHAVITDEMLAEVRSRIGQVWTPRGPYFNTQATRDTITHFVDGIGDRNPLFRDQVYARKTRYGCLVAPPMFLNSVCRPVGLHGGLPGIHGLLGGFDWEWVKPVLDGDEFTYTVMLTDVVEKSGKLAKRMVVGSGVAEYKNQRGEVVARAKAWNIRFERGEAGQRGAYRNMPKAKYTPEELDKIYAEYDKEVVRGANPRYWEDVMDGEDLGHVVKGPLSQRDIICFLMGTGSNYMKAHGLFVDYQRRHPAIAMIDSATGVADVPELVHFRDTTAQEIGVGGAYDYGHQRACWFGNLLTNWAGDEGFVKRMYIKLSRVNPVGDTTWCRGKVTKTYMDEHGEPCVDIEYWGENQRGEIHTEGQATVILPSKKGSSPLDSRLPG